MSDVDILRHYWYPVAASDEVGDTPFATSLLDESLVLFRAGQHAVAFRDLCVHRGTPLSLGWVAGEKLVCGYHGWEYRADGACVRIPSLPPERGIPAKARAIAYPATERYGLVWVCLGAPAAPIPEFPEVEDPGFRTFLNRFPVWQTSGARMIENFMDIAHFPWVHPGLLGDPDAPEVPAYSIEHRDGEMRYRGIMQVPEEGVFRGAVEEYEYRIVLPFSGQFTRKLSGGRRFVITLAVQPVSAKQLRRFQLVSRNYDFDKADDSYRPFIAEINEQDRRVIESQRPEELPLDLSAELHLKGPDSAAVEYRRMLRGLGLSGPMVA